MVGATQIHTTPTSHVAGVYRDASAYHEASKPWRSSLRRQSLCIGRKRHAFVTWSCWRRADDDVLAALRDAVTPSSRIGGMGHGRAVPLDARGTAVEGKVHARVRVTVNAWP